MLRPLWGLRLGAVEPDVSCRARVPSALSRKSHLSVSGWWHDRGTQVLEDAVLAGLKSRLMAPELFKELCEEYYREVNRLRGEENATLETQKVELARIHRRTPQAGRAHHRGRCAGQGAEAGAEGPRGSAGRARAGACHRDGAGTADPPQSGRGL